MSDFVNDLTLSQLMDELEREIAASENTPPVDWNILVDDFTLSQVMNLYYDDTTDLGNFNLDGKFNLSDLDAADESRNVNSWRFGSLKGPKDFVNLHHAMESKCTRKQTTWCLIQGFYRLAK